jgi:hypothetical protein
MKKQCIFCDEEWTTPQFESQFIDHENAGRCASRTEQLRMPEPMTAVQEERLDALCNIRGIIDNETRWKGLFERLFPDARPIPSPCNISSLHNPP